MSSLTSPLQSYPPRLHPQVTNQPNPTVPSKAILRPHSHLIQHAPTAIHTKSNPLINENPEWEYVDIYADEGLTGTRKDKRDEFNRMLDDCRKGKIDKILTKAVSRFAKNISECVEVVKELK